VRGRTECTFHKNSECRRGTVEVGEEWIAADTAEPAIAAPKLNRIRLNDAVNLERSNDSPNRHRRVDHDELDVGGKSATPELDGLTSLEYRFRVAGLDRYESYALSWWRIQSKPVALTAVTCWGGALSAPCWRS
jgi:hypothetical protein